MIDFAQPALPGAARSSSPRWPCVAWRLARWRTSRPQRLRRAAGTALARLRLLAAASCSCSPPPSSSSSPPRDRSGAATSASASARASTSSSPSTSPRACRRTDVAAHAASPSPRTSSSVSSKPSAAAASASSSSPAPPFLRSPLTTDTDAMSELIQRAGREAGLARAGSDLGAALDQAGLILSAGEREPRQGRPRRQRRRGLRRHLRRQAAAALKDKGIVVYTAGVGTAQGAQLFEHARHRPASSPSSTPTGQPVITRLNEATLQAIADAGGGHYQPIGSDNRSLARPPRRPSPPRQTPIGAERLIVPIERYQLFARRRAHPARRLPGSCPLACSLPAPRCAPAPAPRPRACSCSRCSSAPAAAATPCAPRTTTPTSLYDSGDYEARAHRLPGAARRAPGRRRSSATTPATPSTASRPTSAPSPRRSAPCRPPTSSSAPPPTTPSATTCWQLGQLRARPTTPTGAPCSSTPLTPTPSTTWS